nr:MFS transporter [uncultured Desulfobacter sp.]
MNKLNRHGLKAVVGSCMGVFWSGAMVFGYPGLLGRYWRQTYGVDTSATGAVMTLLLFSLGIFMFFGGKWHMKLGTGKCMQIGGAVMAMALVCLILAKDMTLVYAFGFLNGTSSCFIYGPGLTTVQNWFPHKRGFFTGIVNLVFGISGAIMTPVMAVLLEKCGYTNMNYILTALMAITCLVASKLTEMPNISNMSDDEKHAYAKLLDKAGRAKSGQVMAASMTVGQALRTKAFWMLWLVWCFMGAAGISMVGLSTGYAATLGISGVAVLTAFNLANGISRIIAGALSDYLGRHLTGAITFITAAAAYFMLPCTTSLLNITLLAACVGFAFGSLFAVTAPLATDLFGLKYFGMIFGLIFTAYGFVGGIVGPALAGFVLEVTRENYAYVFRYLGIFCVFAGILIMLTRKRDLPAANAAYTRRGNPS